MPRTLQIDTDALLAALDSHDVSSLMDARDVGRLYGVAKRLADDPGALPNLDQAETMEELSGQGFKHHELLAIESLVRAMRSAPRS